MPDAGSETEARIELIETFGIRKGYAAKIAKGHYAPKGNINQEFHKEWVFKGSGFTAFIPVRFSE